MIMPSLFVGHGSPMIAIEDNEITRNLREIATYILEKYDKPKAILMISAHWYTNGSFVQSVEKPRQIFDMYGFPKELYEHKYEPKGDLDLTKRVMQLLEGEVEINNDWGIDHGAWTILTHMFPEADIPVVQLSVNRDLSESEIYELGAKLAPLRAEGYLLIGSGNIVHNLARIEWDNEIGSSEADDFDELIKNNILAGNFEEIVHNIHENENYRYAVPTKDHFQPLLYILGASKENKVSLFNNLRNLGSMSMTSYLLET